MEKWYSKAYRRNLIDMHIDDTDSSFLSEFSPKNYYDNLVKAHINSPMIYLHSHVGLCNYPTKTGKTHAAFKNNNKIKELIKMCKNGGMNVVGYYSLIFNNWAQKKYPKWSIIDENGKTFIDLGKRYGLCCPNNQEYRLFLQKQIAEIAKEFKNLDGIFYDMPFWEQTCHCESCKQKWHKLYNEAMPATIDLNSQVWKNYVRCRQIWMSEFVKFVKETTNNTMPKTTVEFNFAAVIGCEWLAGSTEDINEHCEFTGGDLYGDLYNHSFTCKYYMGITKNPPFEYMTCRCDDNLREHTITKSQKFLENEIMLTAAHHGASLIIDAIDPIGTIDSRVYDRVGEVFKKQIPYEDFFVGEYIADVAVFFDSRAQYSSNDYSFNNKTCCINTVRTLVENHIPVAVIANGNMQDLDKYKMIFAPALEDFDNENVLELIEYVKDGGILYLSSSSDKRLMSEFFGAKYNGQTEHTKTYISPHIEFESVFIEFNSKHPLPLNYALPIFEVEDKSIIKGNIVLPYTLPSDNVNFASIHSNPPGIMTDMPAILQTKYGKGKVLWYAAAIEFEKRINFKKVVMNTVNRYTNDGLFIKAELSKNVEIVSFKCSDGYLISLVDLCAQEEQFEHNYKISIKTDKPTKSIDIIGGAQNIKFECDGKTTSFKGKFKAFCMFKIIVK